MSLFGSKGGGEVETTTTSEPYGPSEDFLRQLIGHSQSAYNQGLFDVAPYPGIRVAPQSYMTQDAMQGFYDTATGGNPYLSRAGSLFDVLSSPDQMSGFSRQGMDSVRSTAQNNPYLAGMQSLFGNAQNDEWQNYASAANKPNAGKMLQDFYYGGGVRRPGVSSMLEDFGENTYRDFDQLKANTLADVVPAVSSRFANSGMLDSTMAADTMSRSAAEAVAPIEYGAWESQQGRMLDAAKSLNQLEYGRLSDNRDSRLGALSALAPLEYNRLESGAERGSDMFNAQRERELRALGMTPELMQARYTDPQMLMQAGAYQDSFLDNQRDRQMQTLGMADDLSSLRYLDPQMLAWAGGQQDQYGQSLVDASMANYYEQALRPYDMLQRASGLGLGFGSAGQGGTSTQEQPGSGLMSGLGDLGQIAMLGMKLYGMSDRRLKADVRRIGETGEGYPKYRFRYLWDEPGTERIGVMADEVPQEITAEVAGYKMVDYGKVTL